MSAFWNCGGGSHDSVLWMHVYGRRHGSVLHKIIVKPLHRIGRRLNKAKYWVLHRYHPKHQYNIIRTGLKPGYYDEDYLILHGCFAMLERYMQWHGGDAALEKFSAELLAKPDSNAPEGLQEGQAVRQNEAVALYRWWKIEKPADEARRDDLMMHLYGGRKLETKPTAHPDLVELVPPKFAGSDADLHKEFRALDEKIDDDEQAMLHRLINIRLSLWT